MHGKPTKPTKPINSLMGRSTERHPAVAYERKPGHYGPPVPKKYADFKTTWFYPLLGDNPSPDRPGYYEVRNSVSTPSQARYCLQGHRVRYWDGKIWWPEDPVSLKVKGKRKLQLNPKTEPSTFGTHKTHQWRGLTKEAAPPPVNGKYYFVRLWGLVRGQ